MTIRTTDFGIMISDLVITNDLSVMFIVNYWRGIQD
jgi:hypothetical protein